MLKWEENDHCHLTLVMPSRAKLHAPASALEGAKQVGSKSCKSCKTAWEASAAWTAARSHLEEVYANAIRTSHRK